MPVAGERRQIGGDGVVTWRGQLLSVVTGLLGLVMKPWNGAEICYDSCPSLGVWLQRVDQNLSSLETSKITTKINH